MLRPTLRRVLLTMAAGFGVFALAAVIILNNPWAGGQALILAMRRAPLPPGVSLTVSNAHGRLLNGLEMTGLKLSRGEAVLATVDTLRASYGWRRLFGKAIQIESVDITGAEYARTLELPDADGKMRSAGAAAGLVRPSSVLVPASTSSSSSSGGAAEPRGASLPTR